MPSNLNQEKLASLIISIIILIMIIILIIIVCYSWYNTNNNNNQKIVKNPKVLKNNFFQNPPLPVVCGNNEKAIYYFDRNECETIDNGENYTCFHKTYGYTGCIPTNEAACPADSKTKVFYSNLVCYPNKPGSPCSGGGIQSIKCTKERVYVAQPNCGANQYFFKVYVGKACTCTVPPALPPGMPQPNGGSCWCREPGSSSFYCADSGSGCPIYPSNSHQTVQKNIPTRVNYTTGNTSTKGDVSIKCQYTYNFG
jgi:hypothetical protein